MNSSLPPLDPRLADWLESFNRALAQQRASGTSLTPIAVREGLAYLTASLVTSKPSLPWIGDAMVSGGEYSVPVRIYDPDPTQAKPVCLYLHGGGHLAGSVSVYDPVCRKLAAASGQLVVSLEYRLAPECPYPCALNDAISVVRHIRPVLEEKQRLITDQLNIAGDSGGGALAASVCAALQSEQPHPISRQLLIYPNLDYTLAHPSVEQLSEGYLLEKARILWYYEQYFQHNEDRVAASPLHMPMSAQLPPTFIITAGYCPLKDEAAVYLQRLDALGVETEHLAFDNLLHAFLNMEDLVPDACAQSYQAMAAFLNRKSF